MHQAVTPWCRSSINCVWTLDGSRNLQFGVHNLDILFSRENTVQSFNTISFSFAREIIWFAQRKWQNVNAQGINWSSVYSYILFYALLCLFERWRWNCTHFWEYKCSYISIYIITAAMFSCLIFFINGHKMYCFFFF